jgi:SAM-dependent methyltransferase
MASTQLHPSGGYYRTTHTATEAEKIYDGIAYVYDTISAYHEDDVEEIIRLVNPGNNARCLDLGCGTGMVAFALKERVGKGFVLGIDCSAEMLKAAEVRGKKLQTKGVQTKGVQFRKGDITLPACVKRIRKDFAGTYDLISMVWTLSTILIESQVPTLRMWADMLAPGGRMVIERGDSRGETATGEARRVEGSTPPIPAPLPRCAIADQQSYDVCRQEMEELASLAGLTVKSMHGYYTKYTDKSAALEKEALREWKKERMGPMERSFLVAYREGVMKDDMENWKGNGFGFYTKNVSLVMIVEKAGGVSAA